jgi:hypothetical protein
MSQEPGVGQESGVRSQESGVRSEESGVRSQVKSQESGVIKHHGLDQKGITRYDFTTGLTGCWEWGKERTPPESRTCSNSLATTIRAM